MNEISLANRNLRAEVGEKYREDQAILISRNESSKEIEDLPIALRKELSALGELLSHFVPEDFTFEIDLGDEEPGLTLGYENGLLTQFFWSEPVKSWLSVADQMSEIDWREKRTCGVAGGEIFDELQEAAEEAPENIPSTKRLQEKFCEQTEAFCKTAKTDAARVKVLFVNDQFSTLERETFDDLMAFARELPNLMTCANHVIAVVANGKVVAASRIDRMKREAVNHLKDMPISYAQASGRMFPPTILD